MAGASVVGCCTASTSCSQSQFQSKGASSSVRNPRSKFRVSCVSSYVVSSDPYKTLRINQGASESDVKKAFRSLALQYHPDVCRGNNCGVQFHQINEAYDIVMRNLREEVDQSSRIVVDDDDMRGMNDQDWDLWEEWMGWEGAGIRDYSSHVNPYI